MPTKNKHCKKLSGEFYDPSLKIILKEEYWSDTLLTNDFYISLGEIKIVDSLSCRSFNWGFTEETHVGYLCSWENDTYFMSKNYIRYRNTKAYGANHLLSKTQMFFTNDNNNLNGDTIFGMGAFMNGLVLADVEINNVEFVATYNESEGFQPSHSRAVYKIYFSKKNWIHKIEFNDGLIVSCK